MLSEIIQQGENEAVEFKTADVHADSLAKELVAFSNSGGGSIIIGVDDNGDILGIDPEWDGETWVANIARNNVIPAIDCKIEYTAVILESNQNKKVLQITVPKGKDKPYQTNRSQYLVRVGSTNRVASVHELMRLFQQSGVFHFDSTTVQGARLSSVNKSLLDQYLMQYNVSLADEPDELILLRNMDIMDGDNLTMAGLLIFGINPQRFFSNACISYAHFVGEEISNELIDKQVIGGTLPEQIEKTLATLKHNIKRPSKIVGAKTQPTKSAYSDNVLRELIVNAVTHRNYSIEGSRIRIMHYADRIEFISPGRLPNTITLEKLRYGVSYAVNPIILKFLENMRFIDKLGRGLPMVYSEAKALGKQAIFEEIGEEFKVTLTL